MMGSASTQFKHRISQPPRTKLGPKLEALGSNFPLNLEFSRFRCYPCSASTSSSRGMATRIRSLSDIDDIFWDKLPTPILDFVDNPLHLKNLTIKELKQLANEIRLDMRSSMSTTQKSFRASLAVVELTVALHYVFHAPVDKILWDVANQTYAHKILTGRRLHMQTLREKKGRSCLTSQSDSEYDPFGAGHGCNSVSAGLGIAVARDIKGKRERVVTVISNESTTAGQVYEAMSNAGYLDSNLIVILNDSRHSLHPKIEEGPKTSITALSSTISRIQSSKSFRQFREAAKVVTKSIGMGMHELAAKVDEYTRGMVGPRGSTLFEELGLYYIGPVDGHNLEDLICVLQQVASLDSMGPVLVHVITEECREAEEEQKSDATENNFNSLTNVLPTLYSLHTRTYSDCFVEALIMEAEKDKDIVIVHAGMGMERSFQLFQERFPDKFFDVGMAEQHAVTFSAGLSRGGLKPFCIIPSTFLQRAYDQVVHDVDRQKIPVRFVITSAGLVGSDGPVQCGAFDITFMSCLPNMIVMAPSNEDELVDMVATAAKINDRPSCFRYPRGAIVRSDHYIRSGIPIEVGKGNVLVEGKDVALLGYGAMVQNCLKARALLSKLGVEVTVADARFCKPLDAELLRQLCKNHAFLVTVEEGSIGGFGSHVAQLMALDGQIDGQTKWRPIVLPDNYIEHALPTEQLMLAGLSGNQIAATVLRLLGRTREALLLTC